MLQRQNQVYEHIRQVELDTPANGCCRRCGNGPRAASDDLLARVALPDADRLAFYGVLKHATVNSNPIAEASQTDLAAEGAGVACVLGDFHLKKQNLSNY